MKISLSVLLMSLLCLSVRGSVMAAERFYTFGVVPQQSASKIVRTWDPLITYINKKSGVTLRLETAKDIPTFEKNLNAGLYDFAYMNPYHYVVYHEKGYQAFAKVKNTRLVGIIVIRKDSNITTLAALGGHQLAFPSPLAFAASMLTRAELKKRHIPFTPVYVSSHDSVYRNVAEKNFIAGGGVIRTYMEMEHSVRDKLRILYQTAGYAPHAFAVRADVPANIVHAVQSTMIAISSEREGKQLFGVLKMQGVTTANDRDWDEIRHLNLEAE